MLGLHNIHINIMINNDAQKIITSLFEEFHHISLFEVVLDSSYNNWVKESRKGRGEKLTNKASRPP